MSRSNAVNRRAGATAPPVSPGASATAAPASPWQGRRRLRRDRDVKREAVVRAAARAFHERGFHNTSLDDIAAALDVTKPTIYYYVTSKEQLLFQCFRAGLERIRVACRAARRSDAPGRERLALVLRGYAEAIASEFGWCMVRVEDHDLSPDMSRQIKALKSEIDQTIRRLIREGMLDGSIGKCDPKMTAFALAGALNWIAHWYREDRSMSASEIAAAFVRIFESGLTPRRGGAADRS
jgi:AcrR family transcriptional regulator